MKFWDASAIVPLVTVEEASSRAEAWREGDARMMVWMFTITEVISALCRKRRGGLLDDETFRIGKQRLEELANVWVEVSSFEVVRERAHRLLEVHSLGAADALQLAAALWTCGEHPNQMEFATFDSRLKEAAEKEGFHTSSQR